MAGEKWYGSNGNNRSIGLPRSILMMMLNDVETGKPLAYMSGNLLSSMRTGAMPGLAAKLLARMTQRYSHWSALESYADQVSEPSCHRDLT